MSVSMKGFDKLTKKLNHLHRYAARRAMRKATRAGTTVLLKAVRAATPKDEGILRKAQSSKIHGRKSNIAGIVGADVAKLEADERRPSNIDWLVEEGHVAPDGTFVPPAGYMKRASAEAMPRAESAYRAKLAEEIEKEAAKG